MTDESRSPLENALDLFVYAPVGLALTAVEELPKLAEKGRAQVQGQITIARMVGQFALAQGRKQIERRLGANGRPAAQNAPPTPPRPAPGPVRRVEPTVRTAPGQSMEPDSDGGYTKLSGRSNDMAAPSASRAGAASDAGAASRAGAASDAGAASRASAASDAGAASRASAAGAVGGPTVVPPPSGTAPPGTAPSGTAPSGTAAAGAPAPGADQLAIPGYDSLSASQVVQRLAGLSGNELEAVGAYESAHRARRTILTRVNQLKG